MKKLIRKILSNKKIMIILGVIVLFLICFASYTAIEINRNVEKMQANSATPSYYPDYPAINPAAKNSDLIKRGEYLVKAGDCIACHTNTHKKGKAFAGGLAMPTPFGTIYTPNITADKQTGIGSWTDEQFITAMRQGISPEGHYYYPAFPYLYFNKISTDDLIAIKAYLDNIPAVRQDNRPNAMMFPFNFRFLQLGWRILFFNSEDTSHFEPNPHQSEQWNRGAYLVQGLGHCAMCHSPSYNLLDEKLSLGAPIRKYDLTGAKVQGFMAPNITQSNLGKIPEQEIVDVFTQDKMIGGGKVDGPMLEANHDSLMYLSAADLDSIANYLKMVQSQTPPKPKGGPGRGTYEAYCAGCHATGSGGSPKFGDATKWDPIIKAGIDKAYLSAIKGKESMPAKGNCLSCTDDEIKQAVDFMLAAVGGKGGSGSNGPKRQQLTQADGKRIYDHNCSVCHSSGFNNAPKLGDKQAWQPIVDLDFLTIYQNIAQGLHGHPPRGACGTCTDAELKAASKYMLEQSGTDKTFSLW